MEREDVRDVVALLALEIENDLPLAASILWATAAAIDAQQESQMLGFMYKFVRQQADRARAQAVLCGQVAGQYYIAWKSQSGDTGQSMKSWPYDMARHMCDALNEQDQYLGMRHYFVLAEPVSQENQVE